MSVTAKIEALLFVVGDQGISLEELAYVTGETTARVYDEIEKLKQKYLIDQESAFCILEAGNHFLLTTKKECVTVLKEFAKSPLSNKLSQAALETLSIIAYKQPITRIEVDEIRGVQSSGAVQKLLNRQLIEEKGRVDGPGRAILYGTTDYFMDYFALKSLDELPDIQQIEEDFEAEVPSDLFYDRFKEELEE